MTICTAPLLLAALLAAPAEPAVPGEPAPPVPAVQPAAPVPPPPAVLPAPPLQRIQPAPRAAPADRPISIVGQMGIDVGSTKLLTVYYTDGSKESLSANQGFSFAVGAAFLKLRSDQVLVDTVATIGVKGWDVGDDSNSVTYLVFPLEVIERVAMAQVRFGAGINYALSPRLKGSGVFRDVRVDLKNALGYTFQAEWIGNRRPGSTGAFVGLRYLMQRLVSKSTGGSVSANAVGMTLGIEY